MKNIPVPAHFTAIEQFLITQAVDFSLNHPEVTPLPLLEGKTVTLVSTGLTDQRRYLIGAVGRWLGEQGLRLKTDAKDATYQIQIMVEALGTEQSLSFFGLPEVQSTLFPFGLPEIALYKVQHQTGYARFRLDIYETATGEFIRSTPWFQASTYYKEYNMLFFIDFHTTNLIGPFDDPPATSTHDEHAMEY